MHIRAFTGTVGSSSQRLVAGVVSFDPQDNPRSLILHIPTSPGRVDGGGGNLPNGLHPRSARWLFHNRRTPRHRDRSPSVPRPATSCPGRVCPPRVRGARLPPPGTPGGPRAQVHRILDAGTRQEGGVQLHVREGRPRSATRSRPSPPPALDPAQAGPSPAPRSAPIEGGGTEESAPTEARAVRDPGGRAATPGLNGAIHIPRCGHPADTGRARRSGVNRISVLHEEPQAREGVSRSRERSRAVHIRDTGPTRLTHEWRPVAPDKRPPRQGVPLPYPPQPVPNACRWSARIRSHGR